LAVIDWVFVDAQQSFYVHVGATIDRAPGYGLKDNSKIKAK